MSTYQTSKDYALLWELAMAGAEVICYIDNDCDVGNDMKVRREVAEVYKTNNRTVETRTMNQSYMTRTSKNTFIELCEKYHVEFIPPSGWIPVSERLPEKSGICLISFGKSVRESLYDVMKNKWDSGLSCTPFAWMPLPEPFEMGK